MDPTVTKVREDKKDIILGKFTIVNNAGSNLELQKYGVKLVSSSANLVDLLENVELYDETNGTVYELADAFD